MAARGKRGAAALLLVIASAAEADTVVQVVVGLPQLLKGEMP